MRIPLSSHFTYGKLLRFVLPSVGMMVFTSVYSVVDGFFVSNYVGKTAFAAVNLMMPVLILLGAVGFMLGTGGAAIVGKTLGEGQPDRANRIFSLIIFSVLAAGVGMTGVSLVLLRPVAVLLGATGQLLEYAVLYSRIILIANTFFMLQTTFQTFLITAEKSRMGLWVTVGAGVANMVLDLLFVGRFGWGLAGAAWATAVSQAVGGLIPLVYFCLPNNSLLRLTRPLWRLSVLLKACGNGASELMSNLSASVVSMLYNFQLLQAAGENGVAAYGAIMYVNFLFAAVFFGYDIGCSPPVSYHYGAGNRQELHNLLTKSLRIVTLAGVGMAALSFGLAGPFSRLFVGYDAALCAMTRQGFRLYAFSFALFGVNVFASAFFTALNNGGVSAVLSFSRTLLFQVVCIWVLPLLWGLNGIWLATVAAEGLSLAVTLFFFFTRRSQYGY